MCRPAKSNSRASTGLKAKTWRGCSRWKRDTRCTISSTDAIRTASDAQPVIHAILRPRSMTFQASSAGRVLFGRALLLGCDLVLLARCGGQRQGIARAGLGSRLARGAHDRLGLLDVPVGLVNGLAHFFELELGFRGRRLDRPGDLGPCGRTNLVAGGARGLGGALNEIIRVADRVEPVPQPDFRNERLDGSCSVPVGRIIRGFFECLKD